MQHCDTTADKKHTDDDFWHYALQLYKQPGVSKQCLILQDKYGLNINLVLLCCFLGSTKTTIKKTLPALSNDPLLQQWQSQSTEAIRSVRRRVKDTFEGVAGQPNFYQQLLAVELSAEKIEQSLMLDIANNCRLSRSQQDSITTNIRHYWQQQHRSKQTPEALNVVIQAALKLLTETDHS